MQKLNLKFGIIFSLYILIGLQIAKGQEFSDKISSADSLFEQKKYTESYELYNQILSSDNLSSPGMLLKMAYIQEGLGNYSQALYFLNLYYDKTSSEKVLFKMEELAKAHELQGYKYSDATFFNRYFHKYNKQVIIGLILVALLIFIMALYQWYTLKSKPLITAIVLTLFLGFIFYATNYLSGENQAIISNTNTYLMSGPSAGAEMIAIVGKGHRVEVVGDEDVWVEVEWKNQTVFVRSENLELLN